MPPEEIRAVLEADDPGIVHKYFELHWERLEERLAEQRRTIAILERSIVEAIERPEAEAGWPGHESVVARGLVRSGGKSGASGYSGSS
jgi:hypothetical protein